jgi:microcystin-dependent protein
MLLVKFTYANTYGDGSTTYPKLQVNGRNYVMSRADGNYLQSGEWGNNATLTFLFDGTDFILPAGSGTGNAGGIPLGTVLAIYTNQVPDGYLPCNGVQFDTAQFAALYALLGDDHTPDLREVTLRGIGHNGTYVFDSTETDPATQQAGTQNHDEYTLGEFKDDQLQNHGHNLKTRQSGAGADEGLEINGYTIYNKSTGNVIGARAGTVTRGKSVGVNYIIKATSGLPDSQQDYILNQLAPVDEVTVDNMHSVTSNAVAVANSYSTSEIFTGKYWIDGKPIYRKVIANLSVVNDTVLVTGVDNLIQVGGYFISSAYAKIALPYGSPGSVTSAYIKDGETQIRITSNQNVTVYITLEYTKTTD